MSPQELSLSLFSLSREVDNFKTSGTQEVFKVEHCSPKLHMHSCALLSDYFPLWGAEFNIHLCLGLVLKLHLHCHFEEEVFCKGAEISDPALSSFLEEARMVWGTSMYIKFNLC